MAAKEKSARDLLYLDVALIDEGPEKRTHVAAADYARIVHSIGRHGVREALRVKPGDGGRYTLLHGGLRLKAAREAGLTHVNCVVDETGLDDASELLEWLAVNDDVSPVNDVDRAAMWDLAMKGNGWSQAHLAEYVGVHQGTVSRAIQLLDYPEELQEKVKAGEVPAGTAHQIMALPPRQRREAIEAGRVLRPARAAELPAAGPEVFKAEWTREKQGRLGPCVIAFKGWKKKHTTEEILAALQWLIDHLAGPRLADLDDEDAAGDDGPHTLPLAG